MHFKSCSPKSPQMNENPPRGRGVSLPLLNEAMQSVTVKWTFLILFTPVERLGAPLGSVFGRDRVSYMSLFETNLVMGIEKVWWR